MINVPEPYKSSNVGILFPACQDCLLSKHNIKSAEDLEKAIDESLAKSEILRQSILKQAFEGRLV